MCRGMPSCPWDTCGAGPDADLWDFCGARRRPSPAHVAGHSGTWDPGFQGQIRGCAGVVWPAADCPGTRSRLICQGGGDPPASRRGGAQGQCWRGHCRYCQVSVMMRS